MKVSKIIVTLILLLSLATVAVAQNYSHRRLVIGAGGGEASSGMYWNRAITGQAEAGSTASDGLVHIAGFYGGYELPSSDTCCGQYTSGFTGNTNCDIYGKRNLADIVKLIDRVYLSKQLLCCEANGNTNGDIDAKKNLADIVRLIDHVYLSKTETAACE